MTQKYFCNKCELEIIKIDVDNLYPGTNKPDGHLCNKCNEEFTAKEEAINTEYDNKIQKLKEEYNL